MSHPLDKFTYCPVCGSSHFDVNNFKSKRCQDCGFTYYANPCSATAAFIVNDRQEMLVVRRAKEPAKGTLDLPGGFVVHPSLHDDLRVHHHYVRLVLLNRSDHQRSSGDS